MWRMSDLRAAIVGYGLAGEVFHGKLIEAAPGIVVSTVVTRDAERAARARRAHAGVRILAGAEELWERAGEHDLVVVAAPNAAHVPLARAAIGRGLPVVVDKPLAVAAADARALVEEAERAGVPLTVFQNRRWDAEQRTLRRLLGEGRLGDVLRYESRFESWAADTAGTPWRMSGDAATGGGILLDLGAHLVDQALALFGPVATVYAESDRHGGVVEDDVFLALHHAGGVRSHLWAANAVAPGPRLRVLGTRAAYVVERHDGQEEALHAGRSPADAIARTPTWGELVGGGGGSGAPVAVEPGGWDAFYPAVVAALRDGAPLPVDPRDAVAVLEILDAARLSAEQGRVVRLGQ